MDKYTATELAYKHGYEKGYEAAKKEAESEILILKQKRANIFEVLDAYERGFANASKWIPVSERLPELWQTVIVCDTREQYVGACMYYGNDDWVHDDKLWDTSEITHWMPLPEPPKEGE